MYTENFCVTRKNIDESILFHFPIGFLKFTYSEKATKFCEIFPLFLTVCTVVKSKGKILQNFVVFSEYMNFNGDALSNADARFFLLILQAKQ